MKKYISIFKPSRARKLIKLGYRVYDIKLDKNEPEKERTIFIFENSEKFQLDLAKIIQEGY